MFDTAKTVIGARAMALRGTLESNLERIVKAWLVLAGIGSLIRILFGGRGGWPGIEVAGPYALLVGGPAVSMLLARRWFANGDAMPQAALRLSRVGRWRTLPADQARAHPLYGSDGFMVSLMIGMLLNIPLRALEYLAALPALAGTMPPWLAVLRLMMTIDAVLLTSLYAIGFVAALRRVPMFPRLLVLIWASDLTMQLVTASMVAAEPGLPPAVATSLQALIEGNIRKVLVSVALWLPYLLLSRRVNVTFRHRVPA